MGERNAEDADHRVSDELLHRPAVRFDLCSRHLGIGGQHPIDVLGIGVLGRGGEADQVTEE
jgi:hypothetical protein